MSSWKTAFDSPQYVKKDHYTNDNISPFAFVDEPDDEDILKENNNYSKNCDNKNKNEINNNYNNIYDKNNENTNNINTMNKIETPTKKYIMIYSIFY